MIRASKRHRIKGCFVGLCLFLALSISEDPYPSIPGNLHASTEAPVADALSWLMNIGQSLGLSSLEFEVHGVSLQLSEMAAHLGQFLPPVLRDWNPTGEMILDLTFGPSTGPEPGGKELNLALKLGNMTFSNPRATRKGKDLEGKIHASVNLPSQSDEPTLIRADIALEEGEIVFDHFRFVLKKNPLRLRISGAYDHEGRRLSALSVHFRWKPLGEGTITTSLENLDDPRGEVKVRLGPIPNRVAFELLVRKPFGHVSPALRELLFDGETFIHAVIRGSLRRCAVEGLVETSVGQVAVSPYRINAKGVKARLPFYMSLRDKRGVKAPLDLNVRGKGRLNIDWIQWTSHEWRNVSVPIAFVQDTFVVGNLELPIWGGILVCEGARVKNLFRKTMELTLGLRLDGLNLSEATRSLLALDFPGHLEGRFSEIRVSRDGLAARGDLTIHTLGGQIKVSDLHASPPFTNPSRASMEVLLRDIHLEEGPFASLLPAAMLNWRISGGMDFDFVTRARAPAAAEQYFTLQLKNVSFSSPDETKLAEGVQAEIRMDARRARGKNGPASFQGDLDFNAGEILLGSFYVNLQKDPFRLHSQGTYDPTQSRPYSLSVHFRAPTLGEGMLEAKFDSLKGSQGEVRVSLGPIANTRAFDLLVREPLGHVSPIVSEMSISGQTLVTALIRGSLGQYSIQGQVETSAMDLRIPTHQIEAKGVKIQFPFALSSHDAERRADNAGLDHAITGFFQGDWIQWKSEEWRDVNVSVILQGNTLLFPEQMKVPIWGGAVIVKQAEIQDLFRGRREIKFGIRLDQLDLSKAMTPIIPTGFPGFLEGDFPDITVSKESLKTQGTLTLHLFGGRLQVANIRGRTPFSRLREVTMDVLIKDLNLEEASRSFKFGQMGGIIEGEIRDLTFSFGQPESFELEIRSVRKRGIKQYVNAQAVNNLSILSTGTPFSFQRGVVQFMKHFPYAKLGIYCKLHNDVFTLRGTIHRKGVEYLIKRGLIGGIDVINQNPENRIRWKQMLRRLKAIGQGAQDVKISTQK